MGGTYLGSVVLKDGYVEPPRKLWDNACAQALLPVQRVLGSALEVGSLEASQVVLTDSPG